MAVSGRTGDCYVENDQFENVMNMAATSVYIVEDELLISITLKSQLQQSGYMISGFSTTGEKCLEDIENLSSEGNEPEIVLMDIHLPGEFDGIETARLLTERFDCAIIFLTGQSSREIYERSFRIKPFGYLLKPVDPDQTRMTIEIAAYQRKLEIENKLYQHGLERLLEQRSAEIHRMIDIYQTVIDHSLMGCAIMQDGMFVFANQQISKIFGCDPDQFLSLAAEQVTEMYHPDDRDAFRELYNGYHAEPGVPKYIKARLMMADGSVKLINTYISEVKYNDRPALHQTVIDISTFVSLNF